MSFFGGFNVNAPKYATLTDQLHITCGSGRFVSSLKPVNTDILNLSLLNNTPLVEYGINKPGGCCVPTPKPFGGPYTNPPLVQVADNTKFRTKGQDTVSNSA